MDNKVRLKGAPPSPLPLIIFLLIVMPLKALGGAGIPFLVKERIHKPTELKSRFLTTDYLLIEGFNNENRIAFVYIDKTLSIKLVIDGKEYVLNRDLLKDKRSKEYISPGAKYDGRYIYYYDIVKYGRPKHVVVFRFDPENETVKTVRIKDPPQALHVKFDADGKGTVLIVYVDEDERPYRLAYAVSTDYLESISRTQIIRKGHPLTLFEAVILKGKPYVFYISRGKLIARNALDGTEKVIIANLDNPTNLKIHKTEDHLWIAIQDRKGVHLFEVEPKKLNVIKRLRASKIKLSDKEVLPFEELSFGIADFKVLNSTPIIVGLGMPKSKITLEVDSKTLPMRYNLFIDRGKGIFERIGKERPFLFSSLFPVMTGSKEGILVAYISRKFIMDNVFLSYIGTKKKIFDVVIEPPGTRTYPPKVVHISGNIFRLLYPVYTDTGWVFKIADIDAHKLSHIYKLPPKEELLKALKKRVKAFSDCQIKNDRACIETFIDPVTRMVLKSLKKADVKITVYSCKKYKLIDIGSLAIVTCDMTYEVPQGTFVGMKESYKRTVEVQELWAYIGDTWYYVPALPIVKYVLKW